VRVETNEMRSTSPKDVREVGAAFLDALAAREFGAARALLTDDVRFRMLVPSGVMTDVDADAAIGRFIAWFADAEPFEVEASSAGEVEGRAAVTYRFRLQRAGERQVIEQHLMLDLDADGRIRAIDLLCSGFRSVDYEEDNVTGTHRFDAGTLSCADGLAQEFRRRILAIPQGDVLVVTARDPAAKEDLPPLARMMGHAVRSIETSDDGRLLITVERSR
jgi:TusA-related sulfurtransferase